MLFPAFVEYEALRYDVRTPFLYDPLDLPRELDQVSAARRAAFVAGRACARSALHRIAPTRVPEPIPIGADRAPVWPEGFIGAISHTDGFACAAVARTADASGVGLDSERIVPSEMTDAMQAQIATIGEIDALRARVNLDDRVLLTIIFSAKESLFKCLYPRVGRLFGFHAAAIVDISTGEASFRAELREPLGDWSRGAALEGRYLVGDGLVHTALTLPTRVRMPR